MCIESVLFIFIIVVKLPFLTRVVIGSAARQDALFGHYFSIQQRRQGNNGDFIEAMECHLISSDVIYVKVQ